MATPYLIADSAQVTVLRSLASTAFGKYGLKLPEGVDLEDVYEVAAPGNELAYVSSLGSKRRVGGMFRRFVRADVSVTAQGEDMVPASDVERVLDEAAKRVSGDFFLESDISKAGLGPWVPFVDFHVGDIANVEIWGRVVPLAVTRIEPKRTEHSDNDWSVHVGGQLLSDSEARLAENTDIYNAVVSDRRDLAGVEAKASQAATAASRAQSTADSARDEVAVVRDTLAGEQSGEPDLVSQLVAVNDELQRLGQEPQPSLMLAFVQLSTALWEAQQKINQQQQLINDQQALINEQTQEINAAQSRSIELLSLYNHGALYIESNYVLTAKTWRVLDFSGVRGRLIGCEPIVVQNGDSSGTGLRFLSPGDWEVNLRVTLPPGDPIIGTSTAIRVRAIAPGGQEIGAARANRRISGSEHTVSLCTTVSVPVAGSYVFAMAYASTTSGASSWWPADTGPE